MKITKHSGIYTLETIQTLPISLEKAWDFFSNPSNLSKITPENMGFNITSPHQNNMYAGQIISYKIGILPMIKSNWVTEITQVKDKAFFIDEQRFGPYKMWHHEHHFSEINGNVEMKDKISFKIPFGFLGHIAYALFIKKQLQKIFTFRKETLDLYFQNN